MNDPTSTPEVSHSHLVGPATRRRLPVLKIAAVVTIVVVLAGGLWLSRAGSDPRFVGTWAVNSERGTPTTILRLDAMGYSHTEIADGGTLKTRWRVSNERLIFRVTGASGFEALQERFWELYHSATGKPDPGMDVEFDATVIDADTITLRGPVGAEDVDVRTMRRISQ